MVKTRMVSAVEDVMMLMPEGRAKSLFFTHMEIAMFYGTKAVAAKTGNHTDIVYYNTKDGAVTSNPYEGEKNATK